MIRQPLPRVPRYIKGSIDSCNHCEDAEILEPVSVAEEILFLCWCCAEEVKWKS